MDDISNLIKEARPLYFAKKRKREQIKKIALGVFMICTMSVSALGGYSVKEAQIDKDNSTQIASTIDSSDISSFYPVDEYGLIAVNY